MTPGAARICEYAGESEQPAGQGRGRSEPIGVHVYSVHRVLYSEVPDVNMSVLTGPYLYKYTVYTVHCTVQ